MIVLFDIDGTLIRSDGCGRNAFERACNEHLAIERALADIRLDGKTDPLILDEVFALHRGRPAEHAERTTILARYLEHLEAALPTAEFTVLPGVVPLLDWLAERDATIGLATGNLERGAELKLRRGALWDRFAFGGFASDAGDRAELVRIGIGRGRARHATEVAAENVWIVGDTPRDVFAAHAAGARALGVATGRFSESDLATAGANATTPTLADWLARGAWS